MNSTVTRIAELRGEGLTYRQIAQVLGRNEHSVRRLASTYGIAAPRPPKRDGPHILSEQDAPPPTLDDLLSAARASRDLLNRIRPVITSAEVVIPGDEPAAIIFVSCAHLGGRYTFYEAFERIFKMALDIDRLYWISLGDDVEGFFPGAVRSAESVIDQALASPAAQRLMLKHVLSMLAGRGKLIAGCSSQHGGKWSEAATGDNPIRDLYLEHGAVWFDGKGIIRLGVGDEEYIIALAHEFPGASQYNPTHAQRRAGLWEFPSADVIAQGDRHNSAVQRITTNVTEYDAGLRPSCEQWLVQVGTAKTGNDPYSIRGWSRGVLGWPILVFHPDQHLIEWTTILTRVPLLLNNPAT